MAVSKMTLEFGGLCPQDIGEVSTTAKVPVGTKAFSSGREYVYGQASGAITVSEVCYNAGAYQMSPVTEAIGVKGQLLCVAPTVALADNEYGWFCVRGSAITVASNTSNAANVKQYCTTTAGSIDDAGTTPIHGIRITTAETGGFAVADIMYPHAAV